MLVIVHSGSSAMSDKRRSKSTQAFQEGLNSMPQRDRIAPVSGKDLVQRSLVEAASWTRVHPLVDLGREGEDRAAVARAGTTDRQTGATFPSLGGANPTLQVRRDLFPGLQSIAAQLRLVQVSVSVAVTIGDINILHSIYPHVSVCIVPSVTPFRGASSSAK